MSAFLFIRSSWFVEKECFLFSSLSAGSGEAEVGLRVGSGRHKAGGRQNKANAGRTLAWILKAPHQRDGSYSETYKEETVTEWRGSVPSEKWTSFHGNEQCVNLLTRPILFDLNLNWGLAISSEFLVKSQGLFCPEQTQKKNWEGKLAAHSLGESFCIFPLARNLKRLKS